MDQGAWRAHMGVTKRHIGLSNEITTTNIHVQFCVTVTFHQSGINVEECE